MEEQPNNGKDMEQLLLRYCQGNTTLEESRQVEYWIDSSEENLHIAKEIYRINQSVTGMETLKRIDTEKALRHVRHSLFQRRWRRWGNFFQKASAILFIPLLTLYFFLPNRSTEKAPATLLEVRSANGATTRFTLPDNTTVCLNSHSVLRYPQQFDEGQREVALDGEGYFEVTHQPTRPFIIRLPQNMQVEVLGTTFNVEAYSDRSFVSTTLVDGHVKFLYQSGNSRKGTSLTPGQKVVYDINKDSLSIYRVDSKTETSWKDGILFFRNTALPEVIRQLEKRFNISIVVNDPKLKEFTFTGTFVEQSLEPVLESIRKASGIQWKDTGTDTTTRQRHIELYKKRNN